MSLDVNPHTEKRLGSEPIAWLNSVRPDGRPHSVAVWFLWENGTVFIFSRPNNQKIHNLRQNPHVTIAIDNTSGGSDVIVIEGTARLLEPGGKNLPDEAYNRKYGNGLRQLGMTAEQFAAAYSQPIVITPDRVKA